jgi:hypothetical protein
VITPAQKPLFSVAFSVGEELLVNNGRQVSFYTTVVGGVVIEESLLSLGIVADETFHFTDRVKTHKYD